MLLAGIGHILRAVALGNHHQRSAMILELIDIGVHAVGGCGAHRATGIAFGSLGRTGIEDGVILEVLWHFFASIEACFEFGMCNVARHDNGAFQVHASAHGILCKFLTHSIDALVEVDFHTLAAFARHAQCFGDEFGGVAVHLLKPDAVAVDFGLDVAVGRAAHAHADGAAGAMSRQTHHANVVGKCLAAELCAQANLVCLDQQFLLQVDVAEGATRLVARGGQVIVVFDRCQFHGEQVFLGAGAANHEGDVIGRAGCSAQALHLLHEEGQQGAFVLDGGLGHGVEVGLVGRAAALGNHDEAVFGTLHCLDVDLSGQVATGVHLVVHVEGRILRVAQVVGGEGVVHASRQGFLVFKAGPHLLAFLAVNDGGAGVLAEGEHALGGCLGIAQELEGYIFVVFRGLGVVEDLSHLLVVLATQLEFHIVEGFLGEQGESLFAHFEDFLAFEITRADAFFREQPVLGVVFSQLEHGSILKLGVCHNCFV